MAERERPTPEQIDLGGLAFTRIAKEGLTVYQMKSDPFFALDAQKQIGQINGEWSTDKGIGYFLGIVDKQISSPKDGPEDYYLTVKSTKSREFPDVRRFEGAPVEIPFNEYVFTPPLTLDNLEQMGHYSFDDASPTQLEFLRIDSPESVYTYALFDRTKPKVGIINELDLDTWEEKVDKMAEFINATFAVPGFNSAQQILREIIKREYPNAFPSS